jgi:5-formyltetrahydrofolate cyclo-ligase
MNKTALRTLYRQKRKALSSLQIEKLQKHMEQQFSIIDTSEISVAHVFLPIDKHREVNTWPLIKKLWSNQIIVATSTTHFESKTMRHWRIGSQSTFTTNPLGILEPCSTQEVSSKEIDMAFVPLFSFDRYGHRVGYGQGFYDRFLDSCREDCCFIGLSFFDLGPDIEGLSKHDIPLHQCITPTKTYRF